MRKSNLKVKHSGKKKKVIKSAAKKPVTSTKFKASRLKLIKEAHALRLAARISTYESALPAGQ